MTDHTPGPWTIDGERIGPRGERPVTQPVALLCDSNAHSQSGTVVDWPRMRGQEVDDTENEANARLLASAPQMLEAIESAGRIVSKVLDNPKMYTPAALSRAGSTLRSIYFQATGQPLEWWRPE